MGNRFSDFGARIWKALMRFSRGCVTLVARPFSIEITDERWYVLEQFIKFVLIGCSNAVITLLVYYMVLWMRPAWYLFGNALGYVAGIFNSFFWNSRFVFQRSAQAKGTAFWKMLFCYGLTYFLQAGLLVLFVERCGISDVIAPLLTILIATPVNFVLNKLWAFKER
ncbi:MAG: GtrA family protein [Provencibacterium sp.]|jgi:putative flippase GtrA|nr:GtrA family protein [Provencibacterium sp.]